jgi:hypothetical protein
MKGEISDKEIFRWRLIKKATDLFRFRLTQKSFEPHVRID